MNRHPLDVEDGQSMPPEQRRQSGQAEIEHVFMVNRVELALLDEIGRIWEFQDDPPSQA